MSDQAVAEIQRNEQLYEFYERNNILPTHGELDAEAVAQHIQAREVLFREKLHLPTGLFRGASLAEFGPDTGQNSLAFAAWGASLTLVEPNPLAWPVILRYFEVNGLSDRIAELAKTDVQSFKSDKTFDFVIAEGSLHVVKPDTWMADLVKLTGERGFFLFSYNEAYGSMMDLLQRGLYQRFRELTGLGQVETAKVLLQTKWDSIPHTRPIDAWVTDLLDLPYLRIRTAYDSAELLRRLHGMGMQLYSSWPVYADVLKVYWARKQLSAHERLDGAVTMIERSRLSHVLGGKLFLAGERSEVEEISGTLRKLVESVDALIDGFNVEALKTGRRSLEELCDVVDRPSVMVDGPEQRATAKALLRSLGRLFELLEARDVDGLLEFCHHDEAFIRAWGSPHHYGVYERRRD